MSTGCKRPVIVMCAAAFPPAIPIVVQLGPGAGMLNGLELTLKSWIRRLLIGITEAAMSSPAFASWRSVPVLDSRHLTAPAFRHGEGNR